MAVRAITVSNSTVKELGYENEDSSWIKVLTLRVVVIKMISNCTKIILSAEKIPIHAKRGMTKIRILKDF